MMDLWDQYAMVLNDRTYTLAKHCELMRVVLLTADLGQIPQALDTVTIGTADRIRPNAPRYVFVIGANEDVFPAPVSQGRVYPSGSVNSFFWQELPFRNPLNCGYWKNATSLIRL